MGQRIGTPSAVSKVLEHPDVAAEDKSVHGSMPTVGGRDAPRCLIKASIAAPRYLPDNFRWADDTYSMRSNQDKIVIFIGDL